MKPQTLKITGINSFNETQQIDFKKFLDKGMFGIFGDTGSGKSTIIDAITLALYGKIVRYTKGNSNGDFLNINKNKGKVEFVFSIKDGKDEIFYEIIRQFKRDNKDSIKSDIIRLSIINDDKKEILADQKKDAEKKIVDIIGLSYQDFTKAVVLPQGKFSEFLMLENSDKSQMLQRIFRLEKYGDKLKNKINEKKAIQEKEVENLKRDMLHYGDVSEEKIKEEQELLAVKEKEIVCLKENIQKNNEEEKYFNEIFKIKKDFIFYKEKLEELIPHKKMVQDFELNLNNIIEAEKIAPHILECLNLKKQNENIKKDISYLNEKLENINITYNEIEEKYKLYKEEKENKKPELDKIKQNLTQCIQFLDEKEILQKDIQKIDETLKHIDTNKQKYENEISKIQNIKEDLKQQIEKITHFNKNNKIDINLKESLKQGVDLKLKLNNLQQKIQIDKQNLYLENEKIKQNKHKIKNICNEILKTENVIKTIIINNIKNIQQNIQQNNNNINILNDENKQILKKINELDIQIKIQENQEVIKDLSKMLIPNTPCPICGATEHPNPIKIVIDNITNTLIEQKEQCVLLTKQNEQKINDLNINNNLLNKNIEDIKIIGQKYNLDNFNVNESEYIFNNDDVLKNIYKYEEIFLNLKNEKEAINITNQNITNLIEQKNKEINIDEDELKHITNEINCLRNSLKTEDFNVQYEKILNLEKEINEKNEKFLILNNNLQNITTEETNTTNNLNNIEKEEITLCTTKQQKQSNISDLNNKIETIANGENPKQRILIIEKNINDILENEQKYKDLFDNILKQKTDLEKEINDKQINTKINEENIHKKDIFITDFILNSHFDNQDEILKSYENIHKKDYYTQKIKSYKEKFDDYKNNVNRLQKQLETLNTENLSLQQLTEKLKQIQNEKANLDAQNVEAIKCATMLKITIKEKQEALKNIEKTLKKLKQEEHKLDLIKELSNLNKSVSFVEYIANRQLKHIVADASNRLFNMSQKKFSIQLLNNNFVIKDHYNGGVIRSPKSLSGGEVFMASLSLCLSLSSKIQLKNKSPLEVFFLDEGFGTLDTNTLDTVINTLEQLQTDNVTVGLISHVDEIKNRVQNKINVLKTSDGTKIQI